MILEFFRWLQDTQLATAFRERCQKYIPCELVKDAAWNDVVIEGDDVDLTKLPIPLQFAVDDTSSLRLVGLASGGIGTAPTDVNFALRLQAGVAEVREAGTYESDIAFGSGDTFSIIVKNGAVSYAKNGSVFYTSASTAVKMVSRSPIRSCLERFLMCVLPRPGGPR